MSQSSRILQRARPWLVAMLLMACLLAATLYLLARQQSLLQAVDWALAQFTDVRAAWVDPEIDLYGGSIAATEFHLVTEDGVTLVSLYQLTANTRLSDVLTLDFGNSSLEAEVAVVYLPVSEGESGGETADIFSYLAFLPEQLRLAHGHLIVDDGAARLIGLDGLEGHRVAGDRYLIETRPVYLGGSLTAMIELKAVTADEHVTALQFDAQIHDEASASRVGLSGELQSPGNEILYDVTLRSQYRDISVFLRGLDAPEKLQGSLSLNGRLQGDLAGFQLSDVRAELDNHPAYRFTAAGELEYRLTGDSHLAIDAKGELESVESLLSWVDTGRGEFGRALAHLKLSGSLNTPVVDAFELQTHNEQGLEISLSGHMASLLDVATSSGSNQIHVAAAAPDLAALAPWLGEMPWELGAWRAEFDLEEVGEQISLENMQISAGFEETLAISAQGSIANVADVIDEEVAGLEGIDLELTLTTTNAESLARWFEYQPLAGHTLTARLPLRGQGAHLAIAAGEFRIEGGDLVADTKDIAAQIDLLAEDPLLDLRMPLSVRLADTSAVSHYVGADVPALGALSADIGLVYVDGRLSAELVDTGIQGEELRMSARGQVADVLAVEGIDLRATLALEKPQFLEKLTGLRMAPGRGSLHLSANSRNATVRADLLMGETPVDLRAALQFADGDVQGLDLELLSELLRLEDFGLQSSEAEDSQYNPADRIGEKGEALSLGPMLDSLPAYPLSLKLRLGRVLGENTDVSGLALDADGNAGRYTLRRLSATSSEAAIEFVGVIDRNYSPLALSVAGQATGVPTGMITQDLGIDADFEGSLSLSGGLTAFGDTGELLVDTLGGHFAFVLKDAVIEGAAYDVLITDMLGWIYKGAAMENTTRISCSMADFTVSEGVATSDRAYVETEQMMASGTVEVDLVKEYLDLTLTPLSKSRAFQVGSPVRLKGPFSDLQPEISPVSAAADAYAGWLTLVPQITLEAFGYEGKKKKQQPCRIWRSDSR